MLRFVLGFGLVFALFQIALATPYAEQRLWPDYLRLNARLSAGVLRLLGTPAEAVDRTIRSPATSLLIERGCDALQPSALFVAAVLASPVPLLTKFPGMLLGTFALSLLNLARIVSLYYVRVWTPQLFEFAHVELWQALFILLAVLLWAGWAVWAVRRGARRAPQEAAG